MTSADGELSSIASELYSLTPAEFTAARNDRAKQLRVGGDKSLAQRLARLPKPSATAWAVNQLVRREPDLVQGIVDLGESLRKAQAALDRDTLRELTTKRHRALADAVNRARALGGELGVALSASAADEVSKTLQAAMTDADAASAVQSGLLLRGLSATGWEPADLDDALAVPAADAAAPKKRKLELVPDLDDDDDDEDGGEDDGGVAGKRGKAGAASAGKPTEKPKRATAADAAAERERKAAERERETADRAREKAQAEAQEALDELEAAHARVEELDTRMIELADRREELETERDDLESQLRAVDRELAKVDRDRTTARRERQQAEHAEDRAQRQAKAAAARLEAAD
jgi:hypothetical protein